MIQNVVLLICFLFPPAHAAWAQSRSVPQDRRVRIFDDRNENTHQPITGAYGISRGTSSWWFERRNKKLITTSVSIPRIDVAMKHWDDRRYPLVVDCELPNDNQQLLIRNCHTIIDHLRRRYPRRSVGMYGNVPRRELFAPRDWERFKHDPKNKKYGKAKQAMEQWKAYNRKHADLAAKFDFLCPSLYVPYPMPDQDLAAYLKWNISEAKNYGKPLLAYVRISYTRDNSPIPEEVLVKIYDLLIAEGIRDIAIWRGPHDLHTEGWKTKLEATIRAENAKFSSKPGR